MSYIAVDGVAFTEARGSSVHSIFVQESPPELAIKG